MYVNTNDLLDCKLLAQDGEVGQVHDVLFDDRDLVVRYVVADTGIWLFGKKVLIAPVALLQPGASSTQLAVALTKQQVKDCPDLQADLPITRSQEIEYHDYFRWPYYWGGGAGYLSGNFIGVAPEAALVGDTEVVPADLTPIPPEARDPALISTRDVSGYKLHDGDHEIGDVTGFVIETGSWTVPFAEIRLRDDDDKRRVLVLTRLIEPHLADKQFRSRARLGTVLDAPDYTPGSLSDPAYAARVSDHYEVQV